MRPLTAIGVISLLIAIINLQSVATVEYRLSKNVFPLSYNITITPYFLPEDGEKRFTFSGETSIIINTLNWNTRAFSVHAHYLHFNEVNMWSVTGKRIEFRNKYDMRTGKLIFYLKASLAPFRNHTLNFKYTGRISNGYDGLYRRSYIVKENNLDNEKWLVATRLERINARKVFPCFDEPSLRAYFKIRISRPMNYKSYSNTRLVKTTGDMNDYSRDLDHFATTPYISTYQVAMVVANFKSRGKDNLFIIARAEYEDKTKFSYNVSKNILTTYNNLFEVPYETLGNPILQQTSVPKLVENGMNWGLIIYKDDILIFEDGNTDLSDMQSTATTISHEIAHSWFGNSITFEWWGYAWLSEGFARYYQYFATHKIYPQYELDKQFVVDQLQNAFNIDAVNSTQPLSEPNVVSPFEVNAKFNTITYAKGATVIRMISNAIIDIYFDTAIRNYVSTHLKGSVKPSDLLQLLLDYRTISIDIEEFFYDWTEQVGFPLLTITLADDNLSVHGVQKRYLANPSDGSDPHIRYNIPLTYTTNIERDFNRTHPYEYFNKRQNYINFKFTKPVEWVMFNIQQTSYYRVMYNTKLWYTLQYALCEDNWSGIHEINRAQFVDDLLAFGKDGMLHYDMIFRLLEYLHTETHYIPWKSAFRGFEFIGTYLTVKEHKAFGKYILSMTSRVFYKLGVVGNHEEPVLDVYNRKQVVQFNCKYGREDCTSKVHTFLREHLNNGSRIPVDMRSTVYCNGMRNASEEDFDKLYKIFESEKVLREKLRIRYGLGCGRNSKNMEKFFDIILGEDVAVADKSTAMEPLYKENPENIWPAYQMVTSRAEDVAEALESWSDTANLIGTIATLFTTKEQRNAFKKFIKKNREQFGTASKILERALKKLDSNLEWSAKHLGPLRKYLGLGNNAPTTNFMSLFVLSFIVLSILF